MEGLGKILQEARIARNLTLEEAGRMTKIRPGRLEEIENEDFSQFASLAYAKGFLLIYGRFLDVDVTPYLEAFETSEHVTVDGYAYLQDNPAPVPSRPVVIRRQSGGRGSLLPFAIGVVVLVGGFMIMKAILDVQRVKPAKTPAKGTSLATATPSTEKIVAPHALPVENSNSPAPQQSIAPTPEPSVAVSSPSPIPAPFASPSEPEVRRAEPVNPKDAPKTKPTVSPTPRKPARSPSPRPSLSPRPSPSPRFSPR
jgi:cytoskeletal protein RodZ